MSRGKEKLSNELKAIMASCQIDSTSETTGLYINAKASSIKDKLLAIADWFDGKPYVEQTRGGNQIMSSLATSNN